MVNKLYSAINRALDIACPKSSPKIVDKNNPWHHEASKQLTKLYRKKQRKPNEDNILKYKAARTEYAKLCRNAQDKVLNKFKTKTENIKEMNTLRKIFEGSCVATLGALEKPDGTLTEPGQPTLDFLMQAHFPSGSEITETPYNYTKSITLQELQSLNMDWITPELIKTVFKLFKSKKSPGTDGIKPIAYKHSSDTCIIL